ncbi:hypothetical protein BCR43DRAFT_498003 [Syncephalastrum racemosum]|uniref:DUF1682-domain-containing protein n=1 Tax=Syncephalastrum racemosum TaxID=13706 RepID=A0A1X2H347_SYNRA|nr:hypothetical protein BCR43DRAFT_498003 [Syncephalastrum racemosum]
MASRFLASSAVGLLALATVSLADESVKQEDLGTTPPPKPEIVLREWTLEEFKTEMVLASILICFLINWWRGSRTNQSIAKRWLNDNGDYLESQYALVGNDRAQKVLVKDGPADYMVYSSGRRNIKFVHWWIKLKARTDVFTFVSTFALSLAGYAQPPVDRVRAEATLDTTNQFVFAILPQKKAKNMREDRWDLKTFAKLSDSPNVPDHLTVYSESQKLTEALVNTKIGKLLQHPAFESLIISSQTDYEPEKYKGDGETRLQVNFALSAGQEIAELVSEVADSVGSLQISGDIRSKLKKNRDELEKKAAKLEAEERAEELAKKKAEAKKAEEERVKKLSPEQQRKWEEKERARDLRKSQKKRTKKM